jgi:hypothetical protein
MNLRKNPYFPGLGATPPALAGSAELMGKTSITLDCIRKLENFSSAEENKISTFVVRQIVIGDAIDFIKIRLQALRTEGHLFLSTYEQESAFSSSQWDELIQPKEDRCYFGLFKNKNLIGISKVSAWDECSSGLTALWGSSYITPAFRRNGKLLFQAREEWTCNHPYYNSVVMFIVKGNIKSQEIQKRNGAIFLFERQIQLQNRPVQTWYCYRKYLSKKIS